MAFPLVLTPNNSGSNGNMPEEENCSICLGDFEHKSFVINCCHPFCYGCILSWSKVKSVCPLCNGLISSIVHNVRSLYDYDDIEVPQVGLEDDSDYDESYDVHDDEYHWRMMMDDNYDDNSDTATYDQDDDEMSDGLLDDYVSVSQLENSILSNDDEEVPVQTGQHQLPPTSSEVPSTSITPLIQEDQECLSNYSWNSNGTQEFDDSSYGDESGPSTPSTIESEGTWTEVPYHSSYVENPIDVDLYASEEPDDDNDSMDSSSSDNSNYISDDDSINCLGSPQHVYRYVNYNDSEITDEGQYEPYTLSDHSDYELSSE